MMHINILLIATLLYALLLSGCYAADSIPGYEYVGLGKCVGANGLGAFYPSLKISADTFDPNDWEVDCATYCNNFRSIGESFRGFDISGYYGCQCRFDAGVTEDLLSPIYMSMENEVVWKDQQLNFVEETGDIITSSNFDGNDDGLNFYCYKVVPFESPLIADEDFIQATASSTLPAAATTAPTSNPTVKCFGIDDGTIINNDGSPGGVLYNAVRAYVDQDCANNEECDIAQVYGWPMNSWCVGHVKDMSWLFYAPEGVDNNAISADMRTFNEDISGWDTSSVTNMYSMFRSATSFNGDVSNFDTSSVTSMGYIFEKAISFNRDVSNFNTSRVTDMDSMFAYASSFNGDVSNFDISSVTSMWRMLYGATSFNKDLCSWQDSFPYTREVGDIFTNSNCTYQDTPDEAQKGPFCASDCQSSQVATASSTLPAECVDTQDYEDQWGGKCVEYESNAAWCGGYGEMGESGLTPNENCCVCKSKLVSSAAVVIVEDTIASVSSPCFGADDGGCINYNDFGECAQYGTLGNAVRAYVDQDCANNQECEIGQTYGWPMNSWCVKNVKDMSWLFADMDTFNENISGWNTSSVTNMNFMFWGATSFDRDLSNFDTSSVISMQSMFAYASSFNGDVSNFDTSRVTSMGYMFWGATSFDRDVSNFDISSVTIVFKMFNGAISFNRDLCSWRDTFPYTKADEIFTESGCTYQDEPQEVQKGPFCSSTCVAAVYPGDVEGFDYVGIGNCRDSREQSYPSVSQIYTFSTEECADFCMKVGVDQSLGVLRGYVWGGDISGGLQIHCNCFFDSGADTEAIASQYGGEREHWGIMEPARFSTEGQGTGMISGTAESDYEDYCYKVIDQTVDSETATSEEEPWEVEETSPLSTDTPSKQMTFPPYSFDSTFFSSSNTPTVAVCPEEEAAFQSCITVDEDNIGSFVDCSLCGLEAMGDDIFDFDGYCERWDSCVFTCPESCVEPINAYQRCILDDSGILDLVDCFNSDSVTDPIMGSTEALPTDNMSPSPTMANDGIDDQFCLEETKALEECGIYDIDNLDMAEACAMCQVEAMGDDVMSFNTDSFCNKWKACANEKCPEDCITPMDALQVCMFQDTGMTVDCLSSPDNANADNVVNEVESKAQRRQVITAVMIMGVCGVIFA